MFENKNIENKILAVKMLKTKISKTKIVKNKKVDLPSFEQWCSTSDHNLLHNFARQPPFARQTRFARLPSLRSPA